METGDFDHSARCDSCQRHEGRVSEKMVWNDTVHRARKKGGMKGEREKERKEEGGGEREGEEGKEGGSRSRHQYASTFCNPLTIGSEEI